MAASAIEKQPTGCITLLTADGHELLVDKEMLCSRWVGVAGCSRDRGSACGANAGAFAAERMAPVPACLSL